MLRRWLVWAWGWWLDRRLIPCCLGLRPCGAHRYTGEVDAMWLRPDWRGDLTPGRPSQRRLRLASYPPNSWYESVGGPWVVEHTHGGAS